MSPLSTQQSFPLQAKRIYRDSSFVTVMSFGDKLSLPTRCFSRCFGSQGRPVACGYFCNRLRTAKPYVTLLASNHDRSNHDPAWPSNHLCKSGCIHSNEISCNIRSLNSNEKIGDLPLTMQTNLSWSLILILLKFKRGSSRINFNCIRLNQNSC